MASLKNNHFVYNLLKLNWMTLEVKVNHLFFSGNLQVLLRFSAQWNLRNNVLLGSSHVHHSRKDSERRRHRMSFDVNKRRIFVDVNKFNFKHQTFVDVNKRRIPFYLKINVIVKYCELPVKKIISQR
jgi:hypothetical protein